MEKQNGTTHKSSNLSKGHQGEKAVAKYLKNRGYKVLAHNYRTRTGEIDLIVTSASLLAFVEVKMRTHEYFDLSEVITPSKQHKIIKTAKIFIAKNRYKDHTLRFDVALVIPKHGSNQITYIPNAFTQEW